MYEMRFSDGVKFDLDGELRCERRHDGLYVVGKGMLCPVDSRDEARKIIDQMNDQRRNRDENIEPR